MKLLNLTSRTFITYSIILAIGSIPIFYIAIKAISLRKLDNELRLNKNNMEEIIPDLHTRLDVEQYQKNHPEIELSVSTSKQVLDTVFTSFRFDVAQGRNIRHREYHTSIFINNQLYELIVREPLIGTMDMIWAIVITQIIYMCCLLLGSILITRNLSKRIWRPFYEMLTALRSFKLEENTELILGDSQIAEFQDLKERLNQLIAQNKRVFEQQKDFIANAAHELQTPLAIFQSNLELLIQSKSLDEDQAAISQILLEASVRLSKLQKALLLLARIESNQFAERDEIHLSQLSDEIIVRNLNKIENKNLTLSKIYEFQPVLRVNKELMEILLTNLLSNAIRYTQPGGEIKWHVYSDRIEIKNSGEPQDIRPDDLFVRFKKDERKGNIGLGLAIVKQIGERYGWQVIYKYESGFHAFVVRFGKNP